MDTPIIDWKLSIQLAGNNIHHANEFIQLLANDLSKELEIIRDHFKHHHTELLKSDLHKLLGGLSYSGVIRLKAATTAFNKNLLNNEDASLSFFEFETEAQLFIAYAKSEAKTNFNGTPLL